MRETMETLHKLSPVVVGAIATAIAVYGRVFKQVYGRTWNPDGTDHRALPIDALNIEEGYLKFGAADVYWDGGVFQSTADWSDEKWIDWAARLLDAILGARPTADPSSGSEYYRGWADAVARAAQPSTYLGYRQPTGHGWGPDDVVVDGDWLTYRLRTERELARSIIGGTAPPFTAAELTEIANGTIPGDD